MRQRAGRTLLLRGEPVGHPRTQSQGTEVVGGPWSGSSGRRGETQYGHPLEEGKADKRGSRSVGQKWGTPLHEAAQVLVDRGVAQRTDGTEEPFLSDRGMRQESFTGSATTARR